MVSEHQSDQVLVSTEDLARLPARELAAFAARCVMRASPYTCRIDVTEVWGTDAAFFLRGIDSAFWLTIQCSLNGKVDFRELSQIAEGCNDALTQLYIKHDQLLREYAITSIQTSINSIETTLATVNCVIGADSADAEGRVKHAIQAQEKLIATLAEHISLHIEDHGPSYATKALWYDYNSLAERLPSSAEGIVRQKYMRLFLALPLWPAGEPDSGKVVQQVWEDVHRELSLDRLLDRRSKLLDSETEIDWGEITGNIRRWRSEFLSRKEGEREATQSNTKMVGIPRSERIFSQESRDDQDVVNQPIEQSMHAGIPVAIGDGLTCLGGMI